jgi:hypothetical protein
MNMTKEQFLNEYYCKAAYNNEGEIISTVIQRTDNNIVDAVRTKHNIPTLSQVSEDISISTIEFFDWEKMIELTKRIHIGYFVFKFSIEDYFDSEGEIDVFYK